MMQNTPSMVKNWPDAIRCDYDSNGSGAIFMLHYAGSGTAWYFQTYDGSRYLLFHEDGSYRERKGHDGSSNGCIDKSIQQLYTEGRAFNIVNSPEQIQKIQKLEEENSLLKKENDLLKEQMEKFIEQSNTKFESLEDTIKQLQETVSTLRKNMPKEVTSADCFEIFKNKGIKMCLQNTEITSLEPPFAVAKSNICIDEDISKLCIEKFEEKGIVVCGEMPEYKMFE